MSISDRPSDVCKNLKSLYQDTRVGTFGVVLPEVLIDHIRTIIRDMSQAANGMNIFNEVTQSAFNWIGPLPFSRMSWDADSSKPTALDSKITRMVFMLLQPRLDVNTVYVWNDFRQRVQSLKLPVWAVNKVDGADPEMRDNFSDALTAYYKPNGKYQYADLNIRQGHMVSVTQLQHQPFHGDTGLGARHRYSMREQILENAFMSRDRQSRLQDTEWGIQVEEFNRQKLRDLVKPSKGLTDECSETISTPSSSASLNSTYIGNCTSIF